MCYGEVMARPFCRGEAGEMNPQAVVVIVGASLITAAICKECDLRMLCHAEGIISREARG